jgi:hypothetical protein
MADKQTKELSPAGEGDARTPDKRIGEVAYAAEEKGSGKPSDKKASRPTPEKQGGIGGP